jgi:hypothetical protein
MLEQMERALVEEDPKLASTLRGTSLRRSAHRRAIAAGVVFAGGVAVLMTGAISEYWWIGIVGFVIMLASATIGVRALRGHQAQSAAPPRAAGGGSGFTVIDGGRRGRPRRTRRASSAGSTPFMQRLEHRWRRRREENGGF